jgi:hypothetical protein
MKLKRLKCATLISIKLKMSFSKFHNTWSELLNFLDAESELLQFPWCLKWAAQISKSLKVSYSEFDDFALYVILWEDKGEIKSTVGG